VDTNDPARVAAILAIHLIDAARRSYWKGVVVEGANRARLEKLARTLSDDQNLTIEPYSPYLVQMIFRHFSNAPDGEPLPTEQEILGWIAEKGGISTLLLQRTRWGWWMPNERIAP
jgi:hypothetical protein